MPRVPYRLVAVDTGTAVPRGSTSDVQINQFVWERNNFGSADFNVQTTHPFAALCKPLQREIQLWYTPHTGAPKCIWWGPVLRREARQDGTTDIQCAGLLWWLSRLQLGPVLSNYLLDPDFEDATLAHWTAGGTATKTSDTALYRKGTRSLKLVSSAENLDNYASQQYTYTTGSQATAFFHRARFYLTATAGTPYIGPAIMEKGLFAKRISGGVDVTESTGVVGVWTPISNAAPRNQWVRIFAPPIVIPASSTQTIEVRLYSPGGQINWDTSVACVAESTGGDAVTPGTLVDVNTILDNVLTYAQDTTKNKPALGISGPSGTLGVTLDRQWQFYDHGFVWDAAVKPLVDAGICDVDVVWNSTATTRQLVTYTKKGSTKPQCALSLGGNATIYSHVEDGVQTAGAISVLSNGMQGETTLGTEQKPALDVGYAVDTSANGGITLDEVMSATPESTLDGIAAQATAELGRVKENPSLPGWAAEADFVLGNGIETGDIIPMRGTYGWVTGGSNSETRRVATITLHPEQQNTCIVTPDS